jgi:DNA-binding IclR family transcriptional regulator
MTISPSNSPTERTLSLIELFLNQSDGLSPTDIYEQLNISRSTLFSLLKELKDLGYLEQTETRGRYYAGPKLKAWSGFSGPNFQSLLTGFDKETRHTNYKETIALAAPNKNGMILLQQVEGNQTIRAVYTVGDSLPMDHCAFQIFDPNPSLTVTQHGYVFHSVDERFELALPICQNGITPDAILLLNVPAYRWQQTDLINTWLPVLRSMAARLSYRLGAASYTPFHKIDEKVNFPTVSLEKDQINEFLQGPWAARLACIRPDGSPHVIPVWQEWDGNAFYILAWNGSQWAEFVRKNPNISLTIDEPWLPLRRVVARGEIFPLSDMPLDKQHRLINRLTERYLGQAASEDFSKQVETIFRFKPTTQRGWKGLTTTNKP